MRPSLIALTLALLAAPGDDLTVVAPVARVQTEPVPSDGDAADDPAIWVHPTDPARSLVFATDKKGGLHAYRLDGSCRQVISPGSRPNNVDLIRGFRLPGRAQAVDLAVATVGKGARAGVKVWTIDPSSGDLAEIGGDGPTFRTFGGGLPYGLATYRSPRDGSSHVFVTDRDGLVEQYRLDPSAEPAAPILATKVRAFRVATQAEGIVADRETARLYIAEEDVGIWEFGAEADSATAGALIARVGDHGLAADVEGLTIYYAPGGKGYLLASSQGSNTVIAFDRASPHAYALTIDPRGRPGMGDVADTDGLDVTNQPTSDRFPRGLLVLQDGKNPGRQNFKFFAWEDVAAGRLIVDTTRP